MVVKEDGSKTAWQGSYWTQEETASGAEGKTKKERPVQGWVLRLPNGTRVPQVETYKHLGSAEEEGWGGTDGSKGESSQ